MRWPSETITGKGKEEIRARLSVDFSIKDQPNVRETEEADELCCGMGGKSRRVRCVYEKRKIQL
jgi:hypothetical protein